MTRRPSFADVPRTYHVARRARPKLSWFVVYTNPRCEKRAALALEARGYEVLLPLRKRWEKQFRRIVAMERALFPRYLFIGLRPGQAFYGIRNAHGVESILRNNETPVEAPRAVIEELQHACATGAFDETRTPASEALFRPGAHVEVATGLGSAFPAIVSRVMSPEAVEVLVQMFGRENSVRVPLAALKEAC